MGRQAGLAAGAASAGKGHPLRRMATLSERTSRRVFTGLVLLAVFLLVLVIRPFAEALFLAAVLAGVLSPLHRRLSRRMRGRRNLAASLLVLGVTLLILIPVAGLSAFVVKEAAGGYRFITETVRSEGMTGLVAKLPDSIERPVRKAIEKSGTTSQNITDELSDRASDEGGAAAKVVTGALATTGTFVLHSVLMLVALFFFLVDGRRLVGWLERVSPLKPGQSIELLSEFRRVSGAVLFSTAATAGVQAAAALVGYFIARVPYPLFFGAVTFFIALIPAVGAASVCLVASLLLLATGHPYAALFLAIWGVVVVGLVDNIVKPILVRRGLSLHAAIIFFSLLGGLSMFGPIGLLMGPMIVAFFLALIRIHERDYSNKLPPETPAEPADTSAVDVRPETPLRDPPATPAPLRGDTH